METTIPFFLGQARLGGWEVLACIYAGGFSRSWAKWCRGGTFGQWSSKKMRLKVEALKSRKCVLYMTGSLKVLESSAELLIGFRKTHTLKGIILVQTQQSKDFTLVWRKKRGLCNEIHGRWHDHFSLTVCLIGLAIATSRFFSIWRWLSTALTFIRVCSEGDGAKNRIPRR